MTKNDALQLFGGVAATARALGVTHGAISQWPEQLTQAQIDRVTGAAIRAGLAFRVRAPEGEARP